MFKHIANLTAAVHTRLLSLKLLVLQIQGNQSNIFGCYF